MPAAVTATNCMDDARALLNDIAGTLFPDATLLPYLKIANQKLELLLITNGVPVQRQIASTSTVAINTADVTLPADFLVPITLYEGAVGAVAGSFTLMTERQWPDDIKPGTTLDYWIFRNNKVTTPTATVARAVKMFYWRQLAAVTAGSSSEEVPDSRLYLGAKTAELAARFIGENPTRAGEILDVEVGQAEDYLLRMYVKNQQGNRVRRRKFSSGRRTTLA